ncbi:MAG: AAA domain-containing protein [Ignavibacteria bacterium]
MNLEFLKKLKQKLQVGNTRSIHLNSFPGRLAARLDISELNSIKQGLPAEFIKKLLNNPAFEFKFKIDATEIPIQENSASVNIPGEPMPEHQSTKPEQLITKADSKEAEIKKNLISKRLSSIYYENEDTYLEHGVKTFGFGYPTLLYRSKNDPDKIINAPVFIWNLELLRDKNQWIISRDEELGISINDVLLNYLEQDLGTTGFVKLNEEYLSDSLIDESEFRKITNELLSRISSNAVPIPAENILSPLPMLDKENREVLVKNSGSPLVRYSGVFGLFKTPKEPLIRDIKTLIDNVDKLSFDKLEAGSYQNVKYSAVETDPTQEHALKSLGENNKLIIHGPPGTGKSQTLTAIIVNALFNNAKCLVVCEKRTALEVIQKNLTVLGLGSLCGLIEDVNRDRKKIIDTVRDPKPEVNPVRRNILDTLFSETDENAVSINNNHGFYGRYLLNDLSWSDLVGKFLNLKGENENYLKLYEKIKTCGLDFAIGNLSEDYNKRINSVKKNRKLFKTAKQDLDTFKILNDSLFKDKSAKEIVMELISKITVHTQLLERAISELNNLHNNYSSKLAQHFDNYYDEFNSAIISIYEMYQKNSQINKPLFTNLSGWSNFKLGLYSVVSGKYKQFKADKKNIIPQFYELKKFVSHEYFPSEINDVVDDLTLIEPQLNSIKQSLEEWHNNISEYTSRKLAEYSASNYNKHSFTDFEAFESADKAANNSAGELNNSGYYSIKFDFPDDAIKTKLTYLEDILDKLKLLIKDIDYLYDYFYWRSDYIANDAVSRQLTDYLIILDSDNWGHDFEMWYIFNLLMCYEKSIALRDDSMYDLINNNLQKIKSYQLNIIIENWRKRQEESAKKFEERTSININALYNKSRNSRFQKRNSLRKIIAADFEVFSDNFPVMLVNPAVCSSIFDMTEGLFDVVIFDEASQLRVEDIYSAKLRGKYKIVSGDENQMPPSSYFVSSSILIDNDNLNEEEAEVQEMVSSKGLADSESLLEFAIRRGYKETFLDIHYRSKHPDLIGFSNAAFYNSRLNPMPPEHNYKAMRYFQVSGIYNQAEGVNKQEAEKVIALIEELIKPEKRNENPSIGVATFNIFQRNYILDMLNIKADGDSIFAQKMSILKNKPAEPFFVKNLENIQGDERDIIIISTTFGKRADGSFLQNFGPINQEKGFRLLNVIVTRAKYMMIVCTSIPEENIREFPTLLSENGNKGKGIFYAYLAYSRSIEEYDPKSKNAVLDLLRTNAEEIQKPGNLSNNSLFEEEIYNILIQHIAPERIIRNFETGGFKVDIAIMPEEKTGIIIAIECDGTDLHSSPEAYAWDIFRQKYLEKFQMKFVRIWSVNWWNNPERETERLFKIINET